MIYKNIDIHLVKIKDEQVEKDPFKRKVSDAMMEELAENTIHGNGFKILWCDATHF